MLRASRSALVAHTSSGARATTFARRACVRRGGLRATRFAGRADAWTGVGGCVVRGAWCVQCESFLAPSGRLPHVRRGYPDLMAAPQGCNHTRKYTPHTREPRCVASLEPIEGAISSRGRARSWRVQSLRLCKNANLRSVSRVETYRWYRARTLIHSRRYKIKNQDGKVELSLPSPGVAQAPTVTQP